MVNKRMHTGDIVSPIQSLENYFLKGGVTILQAAFEHSFFLDPDKVRVKTPYFSDRARYSREHYPGLQRGDIATWNGDGRSVRLDDNSSAQRAWSAYSERPIERGSGYGVRHIWGHPWDPGAFTAGWNLCYMPFWVGLLTEKQHPYPPLEKAVRQAAWNLYFRENPVCDPPDFVENPGMDLDSVLGEQPLLILTKETKTKRTKHLASKSVFRCGKIITFIKEIRKERHQSWSNIRKAVRLLQGKKHEPFSTDNVKASAKSDVRRILRETGLDLAQLENLLDKEDL